MFNAVTPYLFDLISIGYGIFAIILGVEVYKRRAEIFDDRITVYDAQIASRIAFFFLWPPAVLLHECGHAVIAALFHAQNIAYHFFFYWGEITFDPTLTDRQYWWVALAGNVVTFALGILGLALIAWRKIPVIWRLILFCFSGNQFLQVLLWYPALCIFGGFQGDFSAIYSKDLWWFGTTCVAVVHGAAVIAYGLENTNAGKRRMMAYVFDVPALAQKPQTSAVPEFNSPLLAAHRAEQERAAPTDIPNPNGANDE